MKGKCVMRFFALVAVYLVMALPFRTMIIIPGFTDVRPVMALGPIYAVFFGPAGCLASAVGNLLADIGGGALRITSIHGFLSNLLGPLLIWIYWTRISRTPFALRTLRDIVKYSLVVVAAALIETFIVAKSVSLIYPDVNDVMLAKAMFTNMVLFPILFGIPLGILMQEEFGFVPFDKRVSKEQAKAESAS